MIRRGLKTAKGAVPREHIDTIGLFIQKCKFITRGELTKAMGFTLLPKDCNMEIDESNVSETTFESYTYKRDKFAIISIELFKIMQNLTPRAIKILTYIIETIRIDTNFIDLPLNVVMSVAGEKYKANACRYVTELIKNDIIVKHDNYKYRYMINHTLFFKGNYNRFLRTCYKHNLYCDN